MTKEDQKGLGKSIPHKILSFLTKNRVFYNQFWQRVDANLEDNSVAEIIL